jgi:hypothetical protein
MVTFAWAVLFEESVSTAQDAAAIVAVATLLPAVPPVAGNANDCAAPTASVPSAHVAVPPETEQPEGTVPRVAPFAAVKVRVEELLATGPALLT